MSTPVPNRVTEVQETNRKIMLLDEFFSSLDTITREDLQDWLINILKKHNKSVVLVTHDIDEALKLSDKVIVLNGNPAKIVGNLKINKKTNLPKLKIKIKGLLKK